MKLVLVTGATGFIGRYVLAALEDASESSGFELHALSRRAPDSPDEKSPGNAVWHRADLLSPGSDRIVKRIGATHLLHLAWVTERGTYWTSEENFDWLVASERLLRSFRDGGGERFVGVGTCSEYAPVACTLRRDGYAASPLEPLRCQQGGAVLPGPGGSRSKPERSLGTPVLPLRARGA